MVENNVNLKSNSSDIYFKIRYATMRAWVTKCKFRSQKALALCLLLDASSAGFLFWSIKISNFLSKPRRIFKFSLAFWLSLHFVTLFCSWSFARLPKELFVCSAHKVRRSSELDDFISIRRRFSLFGYFYRTA